MEWFWQLLERFQKSVAFSALQGFQPTDWIFLFIVLWGLAQGSRKGFSDMFGKLLGIFLVSMLTLGFHNHVAAFLNQRMPLISLAAARIVAFFFLSIFLWISVSWCINAFGKFFRVEAQGMMKTLGGMVLGGLRMMLLLSFLAQFLLFLPIDAVQNTFKPGKSYTGHTIAQFVPDLHALVVSPFFKPDHKNPVVLPKTGR